LQYPDTVQYLYALGNEIKSARLGLDRVRRMAEALGSPDQRYNIVHVAGTNGKGSTCAMIAASLAAAGYRTGLNTSPHLVEPTERIAINGQPIGRDEFAECFAKVHDTAERLLRDEELEAHPTYFETVTLMAMLCFAQRNVEWAVFEVGLGGRLDATNIVEPRFCAITPIDFDHEAWLGKSLTAIAGEKAGIIKPGIPVICGPQHPEAWQVIRERAEAQHAPLIDSTALSIDHLEADAWGSRFTLDGLRIECPLPGEHQIDNARTAVRCLREIGVPEEAIQSGIAATRWPTRLERVARNPDVVIDGAHNPAGARALASYIARFHSGRRVGMIFGAMRDKSIDEIAGILFPLAHDLIVTAPDQARALRPDAVLEITPHRSARIAANIREALAMRMTVDILFITGSLYLAGEARAILVQ
jgi:dihydrofolate synthase/folylpolyglutamate synthase